MTKKYPIEITPDVLIRHKGISDAEMERDILDVKRHRLFESNVQLVGTTCPPGHPGDWLIVFGYSALRRSRGSGTGPKKDRGKSKGKSVPHDEASAAMGIDWMSRMELSQAIPPAYTEYIGRQLLASLTLVAA